MKICGCKEKCFEKGECWGHFSGVMCKYLSEKKQKDKHSSFCMKYKEFVTTYFTNKEYKEIKNEC